MIPCASCGCHVRSAEPSCPFCDGVVRSAARGRSAALLSLILSSCFLNAPAYGSPSTDTSKEIPCVDGCGPTDTATTDADVDADSDSDADTDTDTDTDPTGGSGSRSVGSGATAR